MRVRVIYELFLLLIVYSIPLGITLGSLILSYREYPSNAILRVIFITLLVGGWVFTSIPWMVDIPDLSDSQIILLADLGTLMGAIARILIAASFTKPNLGTLTYHSALYSIVFTSILIGVRIIEFLEDDETYFGIKRINGLWVDTYHPIIEFIQLISVLLLVIAFISTVRSQKKMPKPLIDSGVNKLYYQVLGLFTAGGALSVLNQLFFAEKFSVVYKPFYVMSRFFILFGFLLLSQFISYNPIFILQEKSNLMKPIDSGVIGWMISYNGDLGPETLTYSSPFAEKFHVDENEFISFSASVITVIGITKSFKSSVFMIPFSGKDIFTTLNITFQMYDPRLKDPRLGQKALCIFTIIIPKSLLAKITAFDNAQDILLAELIHFKNLEEFGNYPQLDRVVAKILGKVIS